ncbi:MAG TPA: YafY family protein [Ktedonobacterales bacterium]|nr:YafY family protein [Ktedonobacterales bacterium]
MYHPTSRVLTVLELLQSRPSMTGPELAARLEMDVRTVRRYITHLQDVGIPVEANAGRYGGYRLRPGFKLPPLMFTEGEATAIMLGLLGTAWLEIGQSSVAVEGALAKVSRVLPNQARERLSAMTEHLFFNSPEQPARPDVSLLLDLTSAVGRQQRVAIDYRSFRDEATHRAVEPYGVIGWLGHWYLVGYCCLRRDYRTFRLDRIQRAWTLDEPFTRAEDFDWRAFVRTRHIRAPGAYRIEIEFHAPMYTVRQKISETFGTLTETPKGALFRGEYEDLTGMARYLMALNIPFSVHEPPELRDALRRLADQMLQIANG